MLVRPNIFSDDDKFVEHTHGFKLPPHVIRSLFLIWIFKVPFVIPCIWNEVLIGEQNSDKMISSPKLKPSIGGIVPFPLAWPVYHQYPFSSNKLYFQGRVYRIRQEASICYRIHGNVPEENKFIIQLCFIYPWKRWSHTQSRRWPLTTALWSMMIRNQWSVDEVVGPETFERAREVTWYDAQIL